MDVAYRRMMRDIAMAWGVPIEMLAWRPAREYVAPFSRVPVRGDEESALPRDTVATLVDLACADAEGDFRDLALMSGVAPERLDELWAGTRRRLRHSQH